MTPFKPPYAVPVADIEKKPGETPVMRHFKFADKLLDHPDDLYTLWDLYLAGNTIGGGKNTHTQSTQSTEGMGTDCLAFR
jgi:long-chain acyl-CoA synthetase